MPKKELSEAEKAQKALEAEVQKNIKRIKQFIKRAEKRGYDFSGYVIPPLPKKIKPATLRKYQRITPKALYKKAKFIEPSGKVISGTKRHKQELSERAKKSAETRKQNKQAKKATSAPHTESAPPEDVSDVLNEVRRMIREWTPKPEWNETLTAFKRQDKNTLENILNGAIAQEGEKEVAKRCEENASEIIELAWAILYGESGKQYFENGRENAMQNLVRFAAIIRGKALTIGESKSTTGFSDILEYEDGFE